MPDSLQIPAKWRPRVLAGTWHNKVSVVLCQRSRACSSAETSSIDTCKYRHGSKCLGASGLKEKDTYVQCDTQMQTPATDAFDVKAWTIFPFSRMRIPSDEADLARMIKEVTHKFSSRGELGQLTLQQLLQVMQHNWIQLQKGMHEGALIFKPGCAYANVERMYLHEQLAVICAAVVGTDVGGLNDSLRDDMHAFYSRIFQGIYCHLCQAGYYDVQDAGTDGADEKETMLAMYKVMHEMTGNILSAMHVTSRAIKGATNMQNGMAVEDAACIPLSCLRPINICAGDQLQTQTDVQIVVRHVEKEAYKLGYRRAGSIVMRKVLTAENDDGVACQTHAWEPVQRAGRVLDVAAFINEACCEDRYADIYHHLTRLGNKTCTNAAERLSTDHTRPYFPEVKCNRTVFAFANGTYMTWVDAQAEGCDYFDRFVPYNKDGTSPLPESVIAANYFPVDLGFEEWAKVDWRDIPTPTLDKVLDTQGFGPDVKAWLCALIGRLLHNVKDHDNWQIIPFLKGIGGSGKSTLINDCVGMFYGPTYIGILSNNVQPAFALAKVYVDNKLIFCAPEIKSDWRLEQAEFQSMVTGELMTINIKNQTAADVQWKVPGILGGNEVPGWVDNSGSIARRVAIFDFAKAVPKDKTDTRLKEKLKGEMGAILMKCTRAYQEAVAKVGQDNVWNHLPQYFEERQTELRIACNSLEHFIAGTPDLKKGAGQFMPLDEFWREYREHCKTALLQTKSLVIDNYRDTFCRHGFQVTGKQLRTWHGTCMECVWIEGADMVRPEPYDAEDDF